ncbi:MAG: TetR/AcrR family transcriptional regulator [Pseudomonadota bacterium]
MINYWAEGPTAVTITEIGKQTGSSKPSLYREFGNDDGLKAAALKLYSERALEPLYAILEQNPQPTDVIDQFIAFITQDRSSLALPLGCLQIKMRAHLRSLGPQTQSEVARIKERTLTAYAKCIRNGRRTGLFSTDVRPQIGALLFDTMNAGAMTMQSDGVPAAKIRGVLALGLSSLLAQER